MRLFFTSVMLLFTLVGLSQAKYEINGSVIDSTTQKPLEFVKVVVLKMSDSAVVKGAYTDATGKFVLAGLQSGNYLLQFSAFDYDPKYLSVNLVNKRLNLAPFGLVKADYVLKEGVDIVYESKVLETSIDKKVYDPSQDLSTQAGTVTEMLNNVPSIEVDQDGNISLRGNQNVTILIDGLPSNLTADNLSSLPASSIERVEIVTNPSAKYDPDGTAGIINLVLKKNKLRGMNGTVNASAATGNQYNLNVSVNARTEKINVFASYGLRYYEGFRNHYSDWYREIGDTSSFLRQERNGTDLNVNHTARFGVDYTLNKRQTLSFSATGNAGVRDRYGNQFNYQYFNDDLDYYWNREAYDPRDRSSLDFRMNYRYKFKEDGGDLKIAANQSWGQSDNSGEYSQQYYTAEDIADGQATYQNIDNISENSLSTLALDVTRNLKKKKKLEYGSKLILSTNDKIAYSESFDTVSMLFTPDTNINNQFVVNQNVFSAYGIYGQQLEKLGYQVGLRLEQALINPRLLTTNETYENNYFSFFPSAHLTYKLKEKLELTASYSRRINRPNSRNLNPFPNYSDPLNLRVGNPALNPEYINSYELGVLQDWNKLNFSSTVYLRHTTDVIQRIKEFYDDGTSAVKFVNLSEKYNYGIEMVGVYKPFKIWKNIISFNAYGTQYKDNTVQNVTNNAGFSWNVKLNSTIDLFKNTTTLQLTTSYVAKRITAQGYIQPKRGIDISVNRRFFDKKLTLGVQLQDVFNNKGFVIWIDQPDVQQFSEYKWQSRRLRFNISYKFGKLEMSRGKDMPSGGGEGFDF